MLFEHAATYNFNDMLTEGINQNRSAMSTVHLLANRKFHAPDKFTYRCSALLAPSDAGALRTWRR